MTLCHVADAASMRALRAEERAAAAEAEAALATARADECAAEAAKLELELRKLEDERGVLASLEAQCDAAQRAAHEAEQRAAQEANKVASVALEGRAISMLLGMELRSIEAQLAPLQTLALTARREEEVLSERVAALEASLRDAEARTLAAEQRADEGALAWREKLLATRESHAAALQQERADGKKQWRARLQALQGELRTELASLAAMPPPPPNSILSAGASLVGSRACSRPASQMGSRVASRAPSPPSVGGTGGSPTWASALEAAAAKHATALLDADAPSRAALSPGLDGVDLQSVEHTLRGIQLSTARAVSADRPSERLLPVPNRPLPNRPLFAPPNLAQRSDSADSWDLANTAPFLRPPVPAAGVPSASWGLAHDDAYDSDGSSGEMQRDDAEMRRDDAEMMPRDYSEVPPGETSAWVAGLINAPVNFGGGTGADAAGFTDSIHESMDALEQMRALQRQAARLT